MGEECNNTIIIDGKEFHSLSDFVLENNVIRVPAAVNTIYGDIKFIAEFTLEEYMKFGEMSKEM